MPMTDKPHETMAERWQRVKPATYDRTLYDGQDNHDMAEVTELLMQIDDHGTLKLIDGGVTIVFSDGSSYWMDADAGAELMRRRER